MRSYNDKEKRLFEKIVNNTSIEYRRFGNEIRELLNESSIALLLLKDESEGYIFTFSSEKKTKEIALSEVVWYLSFLEYCEQQNFIFCMERNDYTGLLFHPQYNSDVAIETTQKLYRYTNGTIEIEGLEAKLKDQNNKIVMYGVKCPKNLTVLMKHFFTSKLFPTSTLFELHSNNYQTVEERSLTRQLKDAKRNFLIAIIGLGLSLLMPIFSIFTSNKYGYTTIEKLQYEKIIKELESITRQISIKQDTTNIKNSTQIFESAPHKNKVK